MRITRDGINQFLRDRKRAVNVPGAPVPGISGHHSFSRRRGGGNKIGAISRPNKEWGSHARKEQEHLTGIAARAEADAIAEGLAEIEAEKVEQDFQEHLEDAWADEWIWYMEDEAFEDAYNDMWMDDGDIYAGTYQGDL